MQLISAVTVGAGGAASIDFNSIPGTYTDLILILSTRSTSGSDLRLKFNSSTTNYSRRVLIGDGSTVFSISAANNFFAVNGNSAYTASTFANSNLYIANYASSVQKTLTVDSVNENSATTAISALYSGLWADTAVITSIQLDANAGNFAQYSTAYLYGILKGAGGATAATP
jgi:hypothetical protein